MWDEYIKQLSAEHKIRSFHTRSFHVKQYWRN